MRLFPTKWAPVLIASILLGGVCLLRWGEPEFFERLERMSFDLRVRAALDPQRPVQTPLGFVYMDEESIRRVWDGSLGYRFGLYWPRQVYGRVVEELAAQGARGVGFDVVFGELRPDHPPVVMADNQLVESDLFFAQQMRRASNVCLALTRDMTPPALFATNAAALGDITSEQDPDGILRRVQLYRVVTNWHGAFRQAAAQYGVDLTRAQIQPGRILLPRAGAEPVVVPLNEKGEFDLCDFVGRKLPPGQGRYNQPFSCQRVWALGVVLAAWELNLDLARAQVDLAGGQVRVPESTGKWHVLPVDAEGYAWLDWSLPVEQPGLEREPIEELLLQDRQRLLGRTAGLTNRWRGKLVVVGSGALVGNNLTDQGATPLGRNTLLASKHWNLANAILTERLVRRTGLLTDWLLIGLLGLATAWVTWRLSAATAAGMVVLGMVVYVGAAFALYEQGRYWIPLVYPLVGAMLLTYLGVATWRLAFEETERRRVKAVFSTVVSPKIMNALLEAPQLSLGGARREVSILFTDVRQFTSYIDQSERAALERVWCEGLVGEAQEACFDEQARQTLETVNLYLGLVADTILRRDATLDKFIGDCVMAFWGAPTPNPRHAMTAVLAAIELQRTVYEFNRQRAAENGQRRARNRARTAAGVAPEPELPLLFLGTGINTGLATVGLMGWQARSQVRQGNYTVFGREVNLASRLEGLAGRGAILISESTYQHLLRDLPALAGTCIKLAPARVKGISSPVQIYEVPWLPAGARPLEEEFRGQLTGEVCS